MKKSHIDKYKQIVMLLASFSADERLQVGALVLKDGRIISTGYNGYLPGKDHKPIMVDTHDIGTVHAEANAIANCSKLGISTKDCEVIVSHFPCQACTKLMIMAGIKKIYWIYGYRQEDNPFADDIEMEEI